MLETSLVHNDLGANHHMWSKARLDTISGHLEVNTRTATFTWFGGYTGGVELVFLDPSEFIIYRTQAHRFGVDGTWIGRNDRTDIWDEWILMNIVTNTTSIQIFHFWAPDWMANLNKWLTVGKRVQQAEEEVKSQFSGKVVGTGK